MWNFTTYDNVTNDPPFVEPSVAEHSISRCYVLGLRSPSILQRWFGANLEREKEEMIEFLGKFSPSCLLKHANRSNFPLWRSSECQEDIICSLPWHSRPYRPDKGDCLSTHSTTQTADLKQIFRQRDALQDFGICGGPTTTFAGLVLELTQLRSEIVQSQFSCP